MKSNAKDLIGMRFGKLLVLKRSDKKLNRKCYWWCLCDCGQLTESYTGQLLGGQKKSCGCLRKESPKLNRHIIHGHSQGGKTSCTYQSWRAMHQRCECINNKDYHNYGGRGITIQDSWNSFSQFLEDMGERPSKEYSLDRINPEDNYELANCRWILKTENSKRAMSNRTRDKKGRLC